MPAFSGSFSGTIRTQSSIAVPDQPGHSLSLSEVTGTQTSADANWNNSAINYWSTIEMNGAQGIQRGYFVNDHGSAGSDRGTFEGKVSVVNNQPTVDGKWQYTGGEGTFAGITGGGTFQTKLTSPIDVVCTWQGAYELAGAKAQSA